MGWTEKDIFENEKYWKMENEQNFTDEESQVGMGQVGMSGSDFEEEDMGDFEEEGMADEGDFDAEAVSAADAEAFGQ